jgi:hypothetical protein
LRCGVLDDLNQTLGAAYIGLGHRDLLSASRSIPVVRALAEASLVDLVCETSRRAKFGIAAGCREVCAFVAHLGAAIAVLARSHLDSQTVSQSVEARVVHRFPDIQLQTISP